MTLDPLHTLDMFEAQNCGYSYTDLLGILKTVVATLSGTVCTLAPKLLDFRQRAQKECKQIVFCWLGYTF